MTDPYGKETVEAIASIYLKDINALQTKLTASQARVAAQAAEIGRLREALTQIAAWGDDAPATTKVAKQALAGAGGAHGS